ncbi:MAG TPA: DUF1080 domain-containing protein [Verrucomicrobiae bacterium]|nr:DUF1080 domain-containing protein [Verrucomicrobiae bacterium]
MTRYICNAIPGCIALVLCAASSVSAAENWIPLFNGKDLSGWTPKFKGNPPGENYKNTFRVEDGVLKVSYSEYARFAGEFGHLFWKEKLSNYRLRVEYRFVGDQSSGGASWAFRNNGVMIHSEPADSMELNQEFPTSLEVQFLGGTGTPRSTANLCTPGTHVVMDGKLITTHCTNSKSKTYDGDQWVTVEIEVRADKIRHLIDGEAVMSYSEPQLDTNDAHSKKLLEKGTPKMLNSGYIAIQAETHPTEFRKIELLKLD